MSVAACCLNLSPEISSDFSFLHILFLIKAVLHVYLVFPYCWIPFISKIRGLGIIPRLKISKLIIRYDFSFWILGRNYLIVQCLRVFAKSTEGFCRIAESGYSFENCLAVFFGLLWPLTGLKDYCIIFRNC